MVHAQRSQAKPSLSPLVLLALGFTLVAIATTDFLTLTFPPQWGSTEWRLRLMTQLIDRGAIPFMGLAFLCLGCWVSTYQRQELAIKPLVMRGVILGSLGLALVYGGITPFYFSDNRMASAQTTQALNDQAAQAELQLDNRLNQELGLISNLMDNEAQLQQQLKGQTLSGPQQAQLDKVMEQLKQFKDDPATLQQRTTEARTQVLSEIRLQKEQAQGDARHRFIRDAIRLSLSSVLLAAGYLTLSIIGFQQGRA
ncbi:HpsJ family protein [Prochlorothrix hollandica]|uniref:HpsJ family protein n=1 Tax=Prochlorothrix hollandica TaxID=1223 RepID=UPI00035D0DF6|nr:HpsJ family protein [Prochlorothrix hollandica]